MGVKRITELTDEQRAAMDTHIDEWIAHGWSTEPADWRLFEDAMERCYRYAGLPWHGRVVPVSSPLVLSLAAPIAAFVITRRSGPLDGAVRGPLDGALRVAVGDAVRGPLRDAVGGPLRVAVDSAVGGPLRGAVGGPLGDALDSAVGVAVRGPLRVAVGVALDGALGGALGRALNGVLDGALRGAVGDAVDDVLDGALGDALDGALRDAVGDAVDDAVDGALGGPLRGAAGGPLGDALGPLGVAIRQLWNRRLWGNLWTYRQAYNSYLRDVCGLELDGDLWDRSRAYEDTAKAAGWSWPHKDFVMVCDRPAVLHLEQVGPRGWGSHRLHCEDGPAIAWRDGYALYFWHGVRVSRELIEGELTIAEILRERNAEVRRCAIEKMGWDQFLNQIGCAPVDSLPDPGNPGQDMHLYDLPDEAQVYGEPVRMLLVTNGTPEPDGTRHRFGQTVPAGIGSALAAQAWMGDDPSSPVRMTPELYTQLARRT